MKWSDPEAHEIVYSLAKLVEQLDACLVGVQRLFPSKDWEAIRTMDQWEEIQEEL